MTEVATERPHEVALREMHGRATMDAQDGFAIAAAVADKIAAAATIEEVLSAAEGGPGDIGELAGRTFYFVGGSLRWNKSAEKFKEGGTGVYAVFTAMDAKGNEYLISTGAVNVVFQLRQLERLGIFDNPGEVVEREFTIKSRETANGTLYRIAEP